MPKHVLAVTVILLVSTGLVRAEPPSQLYGKSVVVTWTDTRSQRDGDNPEFHTVSGSHVLTVYVSTAGRLFIRQINTTQAGSGHRDQAPGDKGVRTAVFEGQSMTVFGQNRGGAQRTLVHFGSGFSSCNATTGLGFEHGQTSVSMSPITGKRVEMRSLTVNSVGCSVRSGNAFGEG